MMDTVTVKNIIAIGIHGATAKEKLAPQRFRIDLCVATYHNTPSDHLEDVLDYKTLKESALAVVSRESVNLLETLAERIAETILTHPKARSVTVSVQKLDIWKNGIPGVVITRHKLPSHIDLLEFNVERALDEIARNGGTSFPILGETRRRELLAEAETYQYEKQPEIAGNGLVREELASVKTFPHASKFIELRDHFTEHLLRKIGETHLTHIFSTPLSFTHLLLQKYHAGSIGITPHIDGKTNINLIAVFILKGTSEFALCRDRSGSDPRYLDTTPGNVILLRAPGFFGGTWQPFHFVTDIAEERITFGLRQKTWKGDEQ